METQDAPSLLPESQGEQHRFSALFKTILTVTFLAIIGYTAYYFYSCKATQKATADFLTEYNSSTQSFSLSLEKCLQKEMTPEDFRKTVRAVHLPELKALKYHHDNLSKASIDYIICPDELAQIIDKYLELAELFLDDTPENQEKNFEKMFSLLDSLNSLHKTIHDESQKYAPQTDKLQEQPAAQKDAPKEQQ